MVGTWETGFNVYAKILPNMGSHRIAIITVKKFLERLEDIGS